MNVAPQRKLGAHRAGSEPRRGFQPDIEGLRALAVLGVVAFHASVPFISGGFVGVDVFFVISGYLITGQLLREITRTGRVSLAGFYARRARRILPAASIVIVAIALAAWALEPVLGVYHYAQDLLSAALYTANWHFIALGTNYLAQSTDSSPVLHFWSLAVEEQFYIVWPVVLYLASLLRRRGMRMPKAGITAAVLAITVTSFAAGLVLTATDPKLAYMATQTRAWEFGVGAVVAVASDKLAQLGARRSLNVVGAVLGWVGVGAVVVTGFTYTSETPFPGWEAAVPTVGAALIIVGGLVAGTGAGTVGALLSLAPVRYIGRVSYAWYLWHWPVLIIVESKTGQLAWTTRCLLMLVALVLAAGTLRLVETPIARWKALAKGISPAYALGLLCMTLTVGSALGVGSNAVFALGAEGASVSDASIQQAFGKDTNRNSGEVTPTAFNASGDVPQPANCLFDQEVSRVVSCTLGPVGGTPVVLFGDSHAEQWLPAIKQMALDHGWRLTVYAKSGCPVPNYAPRQDGSRFSSTGCIQWRAKVLTAIQKLHPKLIVVSSLSFYIPDAGETLTAWNSSLDKLRTTGAPIVYIRDSPLPDENIPTCISSELDDWSQCAFAPRNRTEPVIQQTIIGNEKNVHVVDMYNYLCPQENASAAVKCPAALNGVLLYRDDSHITATAAKALEPALSKAFDEQNLLPAAAAK